jgi:hypothetical protein
VENTEAVQQAEAALSMCYSQNESADISDDERQDCDVYNIYDQKSETSSVDALEDDDPGLSKWSSEELELDIVGSKSPQHEITGESKEQLLMRFLIFFIK